MEGMDRDSESDPCESIEFVIPEFTDMPAAKELEALKSSASERFELAVSLS